jgi:hypothetical protein
MIDTLAGWGTGGQFGRSGHFFRTKDGGETGESLHPPPPEDCPSPECYAGVVCRTYAPGLLSATRAVAALECLTDSSDPGTRPCYLYTTHDKGTIWRIRAFPGREVSVVDAGVGRALGDALQQTLDGGERWTQVCPRPSDAPPGSLCSSATEMRTSDLAAAGLGGQSLLPMAQRPKHAASARRSARRGRQPAPVHAETGACTDHSSGP